MVEWAREGSLQRQGWNLRFISRQLWNGGGLLNLPPCRLPWSGADEQDCTELTVGLACADHVATKSHAGSIRGSCLVRGSSPR